MILPTKHISQERSLLVAGAEVIQILSEPKTVSRIWEELKQKRLRDTNISCTTYDWFILTLDLLYLLNIIELENGSVRKASS